MNEKKDLSIIFRPSHPGLQKFWGKLEAEVMEIIWDNGPMTVKRALFFINHRYDYAYTTVMTVMNHLEKKGMLIREKVEHSFVYTPIMSKEEFLKYATEKIISGLTTDFGAIASPILARHGQLPRKRK